MPIPSGILMAPLTLGEYSALARRRAGVGIDKLARWRETSRQTIIKQEHDRTATARALAEYWGVEGWYPKPATAAPIRLRSPAL
jgi:hypothetical protein